MNQRLTAERLISHHRSREDYAESPSNTIQFGYGDHRYVKFTYELLNESDILKQKILIQLEEDYSLCNNVDLSLKSSDIISVLYKHLNNQNIPIRLLSTKCIAKICASPFGRKQIIKKDLIQKFQIMIDNPEQQVRKAATEGLLNFAEFTEGIDTILDKEKILPHLVDKLIEEKVISILENIVELLKILMQGQAGIPKALQTQINSRLINLITHSSQKIRYSVCMTLSNISFNEEGRQKIVSAGYIKNVIPHIKDLNALVREAACLLLCSLAQLNQGKIQILQMCEFETIIGLLDEESATTLNAVQLIANIAENPKGQALSEKYIDKLDKITNIQRIYIDATLDVIKWKP